MDYVKIKELAANPTFAVIHAPKKAEPIIKPKQGNRLKISKFCIVDVEKNEKVIWLPLEQPIFKMGTDIDEIRSDLRKRVGVSAKIVTDENGNKKIVGHTIDFSYTEDEG